MLNGTTAVKAKDITTNWHFLDADGVILGKLATQAAKILTGKNKATFSNHINVGDKVVITNAAKIAVTGKKLTDKKYIHYTGYPGGLRTKSLQQKMEKNPSAVVEAAIKGMLPKNRLQRIRFNNLYVYNGVEHPHQGQQKNIEKKAVEGTSKE